MEYTDFIFWFWNVLRNNGDLWLFSPIWFMFIGFFINYVDAVLETTLYFKEKPATRITTVILLGFIFLFLFPFFHLIILSGVVYGLVELFHHIKLEHQKG